MARARNTWNTLEPWNTLGVGKVFHEKPRCHCVSKDRNTGTPGTPIFQRMWERR